MYQANHRVNPARHFTGPMEASYYRARYYDPNTGRFLGEDPSKFTGGLDFYTYVSNRAGNFVDPWGLCKVQLRFSSLGAGLYDHAYLLVSDNNFTFYVRGGPEHGHSSGNFPGSSTGGWRIGFCCLIEVHGQSIPVDSFSQRY